MQLRNSAECNALGGIFCIFSYKMTFRNRPGNEKKIKPRDSLPQITPGAVTFLRNSVLFWGQLYTELNLALKGAFHPHRPPNKPKFFWVVEYFGIFSLVQILLKNSIVGGMWNTFLSRLKKYRKFLILDRLNGGITSNLYNRDFSKF